MNDRNDECRAARLFNEDEAVEAAFTLGAVKGAEFGQRLEALLTSAELPPEVVQRMLVQAAYHWTHIVLRAPEEAVGFELHLLVNEAIRTKGGTEVGTPEEREYALAVGETFSRKGRG